MLIRFVSKIKSISLLESNRKKRFSNLGTLKNRPRRPEEGKCKPIGLEKSSKLQKTIWKDTGKKQKPKKKKMPFSPMRCFHSFGMKGSFLGKLVFSATASEEISGLRFAVLNYSIFQNLELKFFPRIYYYLFCSFRMSISENLTLLNLKILLRKQNNLLLLTL